MFRAPKRLSLLAISVLFAACGGGGGGSTNPPANQAAPSALTFPSASVVLLIGDVAASLTPTVQGVVNSWSITPALPNGLSLNATTGAIEGTATDRMAATTYTVTATNGFGSDTEDIELRVARASQFAFVSCGDRTVNAFAADTKGGSLSRNGFALDPSTAGNIGELIAHETLPFVYLPIHSSPAELATYDVSSGQPLRVGSVTVGNGAQAGAINVKGEALYVASRGSDELHSFSIHPTTGLLTPFPIGVIPVGDQPVAVATSPLGGTLYVGNRVDATISILQTDLATGEPLGTGNSFFLNNGRPKDILMDPSGRVLLVTLSNFNLVVGLLVNQTSGDLTAVSSFSTGTDPGDLIAHPDGQHFYVISDVDDTLQPFTLDLITGVMTPGVPLAISGDPVSMAVEDEGSTAYVCCRTSDEIVKLDLSDPFQPLIVDSILCRDRPNRMTILQGDVPTKASADTLYALNTGDSTLSTYGANASGSLTPLAAPMAVAPLPTDFVVDPYGEYLWIASTINDELQAWSLDASGVPHHVGSATSTDTDPVAVTIDPAGRLLFVASQVTDQVSSYRVDRSTGLATFVDSILTPGDPAEISVDPTSNIVVVANHGTGPGADRLSVFEIDLDGNFTGTLTGDFAPNIPNGMDWNTRGDKMYLALNQANKVAPYRLEATGLVLQPPAEDAFDSPAGMFLHPTMDRAYAPLQGPSTGGLATFSLTSLGDPVHLQTFSNVGVTPSDLVIDPSGGFLYTANRNGHDVSHFTLDASGTPTFMGTIGSGTSPARLGLRRIVR